MVADAQKAKAVYDAEMSAYKDALKAYLADSARLDDEFYRDIADHNGITDHPMRKKIESKAYERGHSGGYSEIADAYEDYVEILK